MTRRRGQHVSLPSAASYLHGRRSPLQGIRFHARPRSLVTQGDDGVEPGGPPGGVDPEGEADNP